MKTPGQVAYEAMKERAGGDSWVTMKATFPANAWDWECVAAAVLLHDAAKQPDAAQRVAHVLEKLRKSLVKIGDHPHSFWDTSSDVALIDSILPACGKRPNVEFRRP